MAALRVASATIDGEAVVCDAKGLADFDALRGPLARGRAPQAFLYAFDLLELDRTDLRRLPWHERKAARIRLLKRARDGLQLSEHMEVDGAMMLRHACDLGIEGIVSKRWDRPYRSGRSPDWMKVKNPTAPAVTRLPE